MPCIRGQSNSEKRRILFVSSGGNSRILFGNLLKSMVRAVGFPVRRAASCADGSVIASGSSTGMPGKLCSASITPVVLVAILVSVDDGYSHFCRISRLVGNHNPLFIVCRR